MALEEVSLADSDKWSTATFRLCSDEMPPEAMVDALGLTPTNSHRKGESVSKRSTAIRKKHCIFIRSAVGSSEPLQHHLAALCDLLEPINSKLLAMTGECEYDIFCGFSSGNGQGGFTLSPDLLSRLAALRIELVVDLYPPTEVRLDA